MDNSVEGLEADIESLSLNCGVSSVDHNSLVQSNKSRPTKSKVIRRVIKGIPAELESDLELKHAIEVLPPNYNFEIPKSIWRIREAKATHVALQFPEGLMLFSMAIADILEHWTGASITIMGDVTYGACCVDDYTAKEFGANFLIHYGHSCLIPMDQTKSIPCLYVFVDIQIDSAYLLETMKNAFAISTPLALVSIIQFVSTLQKLGQELELLGYTVIIPQCQPLSPGEVLGCTSLPLPPGYSIVCLGDGRFHLESVMISNPEAPAYLYNPYSRVLSREYYDFPKMKKMRKQEIDKAAVAKSWGIILGTLGRQGSLKILENLKEQLKSSGKIFCIFFMSEIFPSTLKVYESIEAWVQIACPRLSIDWGNSFHAPLLNPYEASVALKNAEWLNTYPMDYYSYKSDGAWTSNHRAYCNCSPSKKIFCKGLKCKTVTEQKQNDFSSHS